MSNHYHNHSHNGRRPSNDWSRMPPPPPQRPFHIAPFRNNHNQTSFSDMDGRYFPRGTDDHSPAMMPPPPAVNRSSNGYPHHQNRSQQYQQQRHDDRHIDHSPRYQQQHHSQKRRAHPHHNHHYNGHPGSHETKRHRISEAHAFATNNGQAMRRVNEEVTTCTDIRFKQEEEEENLIHPSSRQTNNRIKQEGADPLTNRGHGDVIDLSLDDTDDENEAEEQKPSETHIIFAIDFSGSMREKDVKTKDQRKVTRWDAVFECIDSFLEDQLSTNQSNNNNNDNNSDTNPIVSVLIFNEIAETLLERMPLAGDGQKVRKALDTARKMHTPKLGTGFAAGLERAKWLATSNHKNSNVVLVFLSDGRPGDLHPQPPPNAQIRMQTTFKRHRQAYPAAGTHIEGMQEEHGDQFSLQLVCLCDEGEPWLQYLADRYDGTFHKPDLTLDKDTPAALEQAPAVASLPEGSSGSNDNDSDYVDSAEDEDEVVEMVVKSEDTLIREKYNRALATGNVHSLTNTTTAERNSSMRSTFQSISSTVTAMRHGSSRLQERRVVLAENSPMIEFQATRMVLDAEHEKISVVSGEEPNGRKVKVSMNPFAQGGLRNVYRMKQFGIRRQVAKESRHDIKYKERLRFHFETAKCQARARIYAEAFNKKLKKQKISVPRIDFLRAEVYRLKDQSYPGGFRYLAVEDEMKGQDYVKWNSNNGYVKNDASMQCHVAQAFSHFSYEHSDQDEIVVDIQGSGFTYTDPQLHSKLKDFGRADRGSSGFKDFFKTHKCNNICKGLGLTNRSSTVAAAAAAATTANSNRLVAVKQERN